jgi:ribonuclease Z
VTEAVFLGTGNFLAPEGRYWNSFVLNKTVLVEPSPTALPNLRRCGFAAYDLDAIVISHFHPDHTFGWPFLILEIIEASLQAGTRPFHVVGPPGVERYLREMNELGSLHDVQRLVEGALDVQFVEVDGSEQTAGSLRFRAVEVDHVPNLRCFGYLFDDGEKVVGYSGDTKPCAGLHELAQNADVLILECNGRHAEGIPTSHMDEDSVRALRHSHPGLPFVLTHMGPGLELNGIEELEVPQDFDRLEF